MLLKDVNLPNHVQIVTAKVTVNRYWPGTVFVCVKWDTVARTATEVSETMIYMLKTLMLLSI